MLSHLIKVADGSVYTQVDNVLVPVENLIGEKDKGMPIILSKSVPRHLDHSPFVCAYEDSEIGANHSFTQ